jgi:levanase/fructan beta-fructosidase
MTWDAIQQQWIMVLVKATEQCCMVQFERLEASFDFGRILWSWWCLGMSNFFSMLVDGTDDYKWVMLLSINWRT